MSLPKAVATHFALPGTIQSITPLGRGLINDTWLVVSDQARGVLQRINSRVFPEPRRIMANIRRVSGYLQAQPQRHLRLPSPIPTRSGEDAIEVDGEVWRLLEYIPGITLQQPDCRDTAARLGWSLGHLHRLLADLDPATLHDTLPGFHITSAYLQAFDQALANWRGQHSAKLETACTFIHRCRHRAAVLEVADLPLRVIHGDPKLDNVLFEPGNLRPLAWVDLDTLKPGLLLWDIGDCVRSACGQQGQFDLGLASALLAGWWREVQPLLTTTEIALVPEAIWLLPFELGLRFLTDHLEGDPYFKVEARGDNLHRALDQFALAASIERQWNELVQSWRELSATPGR